ncbi:MAG: WecB/TagA/CpsF family glycosyltransferase [Bacteroidetes bacterium]|nr:WecB/TagA/CpsF family glycosyltransferase [Bacteroidota bacterium]
MITPNVDQLVKYHKTSNLKLLNTFKNAKYILPDGQPIVWFSNLFKNSIHTRLTGSDFFPIFWNYVRLSNKKAGFIISSDQVGNKLTNEHSNTSFYSPPYFQLNDSKAFNQVLKASLLFISDNKPDFVIIGLGFPKQEYLALEIMNVYKESKQKAPFMLLLGASAEFYTKSKQRAPKLFQRIGIEFVHRMLTEPRRMLKRYLIDDLAFISLMWKELKNQLKH